MNDLNLASSLHVISSALRRIYLRFLLRCESLRLFVKKKGRQGVAEEEERVFPLLCSEIRFLIELCSGGIDIGRAI